MAFFSRKKKADTETKVPAVGKVAAKALSTDRNLAAVIIGPRITEKAVSTSAGMQPNSWFVMLSRRFTV